MNARDMLTCSCRLRSGWPRILRKYQIGTSRMKIVTELVTALTMS